jgi:hypothetical protein
LRSIAEFAEAQRGLLLDLPRRQGNRVNAPDLAKDARSPGRGKAMSKRATARAVAQKLKGFWAAPEPQASCASEISQLGRDKSTRRANHFRFSEMKVKPRNQK